MSRIEWGVSLSKDVGGGKEVGGWGVWNPSAELDNAKKSFHAFSVYNRVFNTWVACAQRWLPPWGLKAFRKTLSRLSPWALPGGRVLG